MEIDQSPPARRASSARSSPSGSAPTSRDAASMTAADDAGFEAKRFNLFTNTRVSDFVRIGAEIEFEEGGEEVKLEYAAIDLL